MNRLAHNVVAAEGKRNVADAARNFAMRQRRFDPARRFDEIDRVIIMLLHARCNGEDVWIENNILRGETNLLRQNFVGARADFDLAIGGIGLPSLVKSHHHDRRAIPPNQSRLLLEFLFPFLQRNRIHHAFALRAFQPRFNHAPLG
jgi:hypothetical protein